VRNERVSCRRPPRRVSLGTPMVTSIPALAMSIPAARVGEQRLVFCFNHHRSYDDRGYTVAAVRGSCGASGNLVRGLEAPGNSPEKQLPAFRLFDGVWPAKAKRRLGACFVPHGGSFPAWPRG
jgi:hypothetical protein